MRRLVCAICTVLVSACLLVVGQSSASAAPGAQGRIRFGSYACSPATACQNESVQPAGFVASADPTFRVERRLAGYAYNPRTAPVQNYVLKFYNGYGNLVHTSAEYTANLADSRDAARVGSSSSRIGWHYSSGFQSSNSAIATASKACLFVHDKGEVGNWTKANCQVLYTDPDEPTVY